MTQTPRQPPVQFRDVTLDAALGQRAEPGESLGSVARVHLRRLFDAMPRERLPLLDDEWTALRTATISREFGVTGPYHLQHSVLDAQAAGELPEGLDVDTLVGKLRALTAMQEVVVVDLLEGWRRSE